MNRCLIIAEAGVNHNGDLSTALKLCKAAKDAGADVVKFQTWKTEALITRSVGQAKYQAENTNKEESQFDMLKRLELSYDDFRAVKAYCDEIGICFASTADEPESLDFLIDLGIPFIKIGSGDICNIPFLRYMGSKNLPVILSTGMSTSRQVEISVKALEEGGCRDITLLHCTTNYPAPFKDVNLKAMLTLKNEFGFKVGYSDHTLGSEVAVAAVALGAEVIEKHFTLNRSMPGPDHKASTEPEEFKRMVNEIRNVQSALGTGKKVPTEAETEIKKVVTKRIVAKKDIKKGEIFSFDNLCVKRNDEGLSAENWDYCLGKKAEKDFKKDCGIII